MMMVIHLRAPNTVTGCKLLESVTLTRDIKMTTLMILTEYYLTKKVIIVFKTRYELKFSDYGLCGYEILISDLT